MSSVSITPSTLADWMVSRSVVVNVALVAGGAVLVGLSAQLAIPLWPVPITGQTLAVLLVGSALGAWRGALSLALYAAGGVLGVPWFSDATSGWVIIIGPTGGYIIGFIAAAALVGWFAERSWDRRFLLALAGFAGGTVLPFAFGLPWLAASLGLDLGETLQAGLYPFVVGGAIKALIAATLIYGIWRTIMGITPHLSRPRVPGPETPDSTFRRKD